MSFVDEHESKENGVWDVGEGLEDIMRGILYASEIAVAFETGGLSLVAEEALTTALQTGAVKLITNEIDHLVTEHNPWMHDIPTPLQGRPLRPLRSGSHDTVIAPNLRSIHSPHFGTREGHFSRQNLPDKLPATTPSSNHLPHAHNNVIANPGEFSGHQRDARNRIQSYSMLGMGVRPQNVDTSGSGKSAFSSTQSHQHGPAPHSLPKSALY